MINLQINRLCAYALHHQLIMERDRLYAIHLLLDLLQLHSYEDVDVMEVPTSIDEVLGNILDFAVEKKLIQDTIDERDRLDTKIMNCFMPRPSEIEERFQAIYTIDQEMASDYFYELSCNSNYVRTERIAKNLVWQTKGKYGCYDITINLAKPEKDPRDIVASSKQKSSAYPLCLICKENEGFSGNEHRPARQTLRLLAVHLDNEQWYLQFSPYGYFHQHFILLHHDHVPMQISHKTFLDLMNFLDFLPHYFIGSNADLPIVGGSILSHNHYQGGKYSMPMEYALSIQDVQVKHFEELQIVRLYWPLCVFRVRGNKERVALFGSYLLEQWSIYTDEEAHIYAFSNGVPHNTITPIARKKGEVYEMDFVLRNNHTTSEFPYGYFHPHEELHAIKKENIGLIEVMGLAILPARLKQEMQVMKKVLEGKSISDGEKACLEKHMGWFEKCIRKYPKDCDVDSYLQDQIGYMFEKVLEQCNVFPYDDIGKEAFTRFVKKLNEESENEI